MSRTKLHDRRVKVGFSQIQLSKLTGVSVNTIRHYEHGIRRIEDANLKTLLNISNVLGCRFYELFDDLDLMNLTTGNISSIVKV